TGVFRQRAYARIRHPPGAWSAARATSRKRGRAGRRHGRGRHRGRRSVRIRAGACSTQLFRRRSDAWPAAAGPLCVCAADGGGGRVDAAGGARRARRCDSSAPFGMNVTALVAFEANEGTTFRRKTLYPLVVATWLG